MKNKEFNYEEFFSKYRQGVWDSGRPRVRFYDYIIPKLVKKGAPIYVVETGTMFVPFEQNMGAFTLIMADLIKNYTGGRIYTVDLSEKHINLCKEYTKEFSDVIEYVQSDSIEYFKSLDKEIVNKFDLVYLDSFDLSLKEPHPSMQHHMNELLALYPNLKMECGIAIDDNYLPSSWITWNMVDSEGKLLSTEIISTDNSILGKGKYCDEFLQKNGWDRFDEMTTVGANNIFYYERASNKRRPSAKFHFDENVAMNINDNFYVQYLDFYDNKLLNKIVNPNDVVIDVGASCGTFANACLMRGAGKVICLEPSPSFQILSKTFGPEVVCINAALSTKDEDREFFFTNYTTLNTFHIDSQLKTDSEDRIRNPKKSIVKCITLETLFKQVDASTINILKLDIEGHEYEIFENINSDLLNSVENVLIEFHHNDNKQIEKITRKLEVAGFSFDYLNIKMENENTQNSLRGVIHGYRNK